MRYLDNNKTSIAISTEISNIKYKIIEIEKIVRAETNSFCIVYAQATISFMFLNKWRCLSYLIELYYLNRSNFQGMIIFCVSVDIWFKKKLLEIPTFLRNFSFFSLAHPQYKKLKILKTYIFNFFKFVIVAVNNESSRSPLPPKR